MTIKNTDVNYKTFSLNFLPSSGTVTEINDSIPSLYRELGFNSATFYEFSNSLTSDNIIDKSQVISKNERNILLDAGIYTFNGFWQCFKIK